MINIIKIYNLEVILISVFLCFFLNKIFKKWDLVEQIKKRKIHNKPTAFSGGTILIILYFYMIANSNYNHRLEEIIIISSFVFLIGLIDDVKEISPLNKIILLAFPILFLIINNNYIVSDFGTYEIIGNINIKKLGIIFTFLSIIFFINAYNYIDGIDGLALMHFLIFQIYYYIILEDIRVTNFLILMMIPTLIVLFFNLISVESLKVFIGNSGSLAIGFIMSFFSIFINLKYNLHPILIVWPLSLITYDFISVNIFRFYKKINIFTANNNDHLHHVFYKKITKNHLIISMCISMITIIFCIIGYNTYKYFGALYSGILFVVLFPVYYFIKLKFYNTENKSSLIN
jgi:UDP-GlcNAc:undecaprenyl-phosphate GlcNAc-1-phosphate transferase